MAYEPLAGQSLEYACQIEDPYQKKLRILKKFRIRLCALFYKQSYFCYFRPILHVLLPWQKRDKIIE